MLFLLHLPAESRNLIDSPKLSRETCNFILAAVFQSTCKAVHRALTVTRKVSREDWNKTFGAATEKWVAIRKERENQK
jgi:hypothetical protein